MRSNVVTAVLALLAGFAGGVLSQQVVRPAQAAAVITPVVTARAFRLVDANGKLLARFEQIAYPKQKAVPAIVFYGQKRQQLDVRPDGIFFGRGFGDEDLGIGYADQTSPAIYFWHNKIGRLGIMLDASQEGKPSISMYDENSKATWTAP
jgi:hypothetical protein